MNNNEKISYFGSDMWRGLDFALLIAFGSNVNTKLTSLKLASIQLTDGVLRILFTTEFDEAETLGAVRITIIDDANTIHTACLQMKELGPMKSNRTS